MKNLKLSKVRLTSHKGQMFVLSAMVIAIYIISIAAAFIELQKSRYSFESESVLEEVYSDSEREIQNYLIFLLANYTNNPSFSRSSVIDSIYTFTRTVDRLNALRGITSVITIQENYFVIEAKQSSTGNVSENTNYYVKISGQFEISLYEISTQSSISGILELSYQANFSVQGNILTITENFGDVFVPCEGYQVQLVIGSQTISASKSQSKTGVYIFDSYSSIDNEGIIFVTLYNGVRLIT